MNYWSKMQDFWLQKLKPFIPTYVKDGDQVLDEVENLKLTPFDLLFVTGANSMYNNIDTDHAIIVITWWMEDSDEGLWCSKEQTVFVAKLFGQASQELQVLRTICR